MRNERFIDPRFFAKKSSYTAEIIFQPESNLFSVEYCGLVDLGGIFKRILLYYDEAAGTFSHCGDMTGEDGDESTSGKNSCINLLYYLPTEVALHNRPEDCWVSYLGGVYDLTALCYEWKYCREVRPILAHAGKDISHWFDHERGDIRYHVNPLTGVRVPYCPHGPIPDVGPGVPTTMWRPLNRCPWWLDESRYKKGYLTKNSRPCRIVNVLTGDAAVVSVCEEDTITRIQQRFLNFNAHGGSYEWKFEGKRIEMSGTLADNGIPDERDRYVASGLPEDIYIPSLLCYYKDDLTEA